MKIEYKGYIITTQPNDPRSIVIKNAKQGGSLPVKLSGFYTSTPIAKHDIDLYTAGSKSVKE